MPDNFSSILTFGQHNVHRITSYHTANVAEDVVKDLFEVKGTVERGGALGVGVVGHQIWGMSPLQLPKSQLRVWFIT
jgi:hypothetical protein